MTTSTTSNDPRYPVGEFDAAASADPGPRTANIATIRKLPEALKAAVAGLSDAQLDTPYRDGGWTLRQLVHHVADSHANAYIRIKLALTEDWPTIKPYQQSAWAELPDSRLPVSISLDLLTSLHTRLAALLDSLTEADFAPGFEPEFQRGYVHPELGRQSLTQVVAMYAWHCRHHTAHATELRSRMGW